MSRFLSRWLCLPALFLLRLVLTTATATGGLFGRLLTYLGHRARLREAVRAAKQASLALGETLHAQGKGDEDLRRRITVCDPPGAKSSRQRDELLRQLARQTLDMP